MTEGVAVPAFLAVAVGRSMRSCCPFFARVAVIDAVCILQRVRLVSDFYETRECARDVGIGEDALGTVLEAYTCENCTAPFRMIFQPWVNGEKTSNTSISLGLYLLRVS